MKTLLFLAFVSLPVLAQKIHVNETEPGVTLPKVEGTQSHAAPVSLVEAQVAFQNKVFSKAGVQAKVSTLDFEAKEDLLEVIEEDGEAVFLKKYPNFSAAEAKKLRTALYE